MSHYRQIVTFCLLTSLAISLLAVLVYWPIFANDFVVWDDGLFITDNPHIRGLSPQHVWWMLTSLELEYWHPLPWLGLAVNYHFFELNAGGYHAVSLALHIAISVWVGILSCVLFNLYRYDTLVVATWPSRWVGLTAAALFAVHPQHVEVVAWASELKELLCEFYYFPALLSYLLYCRSHHSRYWYGLSLLLFAFALNAKPMAVSLPVVLLVLDIYPLRRWPQHTLSQLVWEKLPFFALAIAIGVLTIWEQHAIGTLSGTTNVDLLARILNAAHSVLMYLQQWLLPLHLYPFYPYRDAYLQHHWQAWWPLLSVIVISLSLLHYAKAVPYLLTAWLVYLLTVGPVAGVLQVGAQAAADRYAYLSTWPFYVLASALLVQGHQWLHSQKKVFLANSGVLIFIAVLMVLSLLSTKQSLVWRNNLTLWTYAVEHAPNHPIPVGNLGAAYLATGYYAEAARVFERLVASPNYQDPGDYYNLASAYMQLERYSDAQHLYETVLARQLDVGDRLVYVYANLAWLYQFNGQLAAAVALAKQALALQPDNPKAQAILAERQ